jgi:hypothetical protein
MAEQHLIEFQCYYQSKLVPKQFYAKTDKDAARKAFRYVCDTYGVTEADIEIVNRERETDLRYQYSATRKPIWQA